VEDNAMTLIGPLGPDGREKILALEQKLESVNT
jgi:hypothetical protein